MPSSSSLVAENDHTLIVYRVIDAVIGSDDALLMRINSVTGCT